MYGCRPIPAHFSCRPWSGARVFLNGCRPVDTSFITFLASGARVFLNGCRPKFGAISKFRTSGARVFLNGCRPIRNCQRQYKLSGACVFVWCLCVCLGLVFFLNKYLIGIDFYSILMKISSLSYRQLFGTCVLNVFLYLQRLDLNHIICK